MNANKCGELISSAQSLSAQKQFHVLARPKKPDFLDKFSSSKEKFHSLRPISTATKSISVRNQNQVSNEQRNPITGTKVEEKPQKPLVRLSGRFNSVTAENFLSRDQVFQTKNKGKFNTTTNHQQNEWKPSIKLFHQSD